MTEKANGIAGTTETLTAGNGFTRRSFFQLTGGAAVVGLLLTACKRTPPDTLYLGSGDTGVLNTLLLVETVIRDMYLQANKTPYYGMDKSELELTADLSGHAIAHETIIRNITGKKAVTNVVTDLSPITFADRANTLGNFARLEDIAVAAYSGAAKRLENKNYIMTLGKIASVHARQSAYARDVLAHNTFSDNIIVDGNGLGQSKSPQEVFALLKPFLQSKFDSTTLPA